MSANAADNISSLLVSPIEGLLNTKIVLIEGDMTADQALLPMKERSARCVLVSRKGEVIGIVSKTDILFKVMAQGKNPSKVKLREIMTSPVLAVSPHNTIQDTLAIMDRHAIRQVIVSSQSAVLGMVSRDEIFEKIHMSTISTADAAISGTPVCIINPKAIVYLKDAHMAKLVCPYCDSPFDTKEGLSGHIDRVHAGSGVAEGDVRRLFE